VVVERAWIGGSSSNIACLPSKNVIYSAKAISLAGRAAEFGIAAGPVKVDMAGIFARRRKCASHFLARQLGRPERPTVQPARN
jgi:pyruvate/2-oxoglutarate dehydrogenase complex dihydrolipoamide dehydrogenase (E3) component